MQGIFESGKINFFIFKDIKKNNTIACSDERFLWLNIHLGVCFSQLQVPADGLNHISM